MKLIFAGTPDFAAVALKSLLDAGHELLLVLTQPDRPSGRGMKLTPSPVKRLAEAHNLPVRQPLSLKRDEDACAAIAALAADAMIVAAYGLILPANLLAVPRFGCVNIHASLLPRWRGAAPIQRAIEAGDTETGISIMQLEAGLDTGPVFIRAKTPIHPDDTAATLHDRLAGLGARLICETLPLLPMPGEIQDDACATYANKIDPAETVLDWQKDAKLLARQVRAFYPARAELLGEPLKIWAARPLLLPHNAPPGSLLTADDEGIAVACAQGALLITELQKAGGKRLPAAAFLRGAPAFRV